MKPTVPAVISGVITRFNGNGRQFGYPTANLTTDTDLDDGVYFGYGTMGEWSDHPALVFVGIPTTVGDTERRVEVHMLDIPDQDYYDQTLSISVNHYHRPNQNFENVEKLLAVMKDDEAVARQWFNDQATSADVRAS